MITMTQLRAAAVAVGVVALAGCSRMVPPPMFVSPPPPALSSAAPTTPAPVATQDAAPAPGALKRIAITDPPVVTGLPGPLKCHGVGKLPDPACTPGSVNPAVTQASIGSTICQSGWTATVRPSAVNTTPVKTRSMIAYGVVPSARSITELDHVVPLELGGSNDTSNVWAELSDLPGHGFNNSKDVTETSLKVAVCAHKVTLSAAQLAIATNWMTAEHVLGLK